MPVLDLKQQVDRETKRIECTVHYKKTHINIKERSNHPPCVKKGIIKGFAGRARALCDEKHVPDKPKNVEDVFVANGFERKIVQRYMEESKREEKEDQTEEQGYRGYRN